MVAITLTFVLTFFLYIFWLRRLSPQTADGAIVMALGIMINGAFQQVKILKNNVAYYFTILLIALILNLVFAYVRDIYRGIFYKTHLENPISSFATGTWIAGISVSTVSISIVIPELKAISIVLFYLNFFLWGNYILLIGRNYFKLLKYTASLTNNVNGIILLAAVATQSIVVSGNGIFELQFPQGFSITLITLGLILYFLGLILILVRYLWKNPGNLPDDWQNTNCIIHGAMSISGLASALSHSININIVASIWLWIIFTFIIVETIEIIRGVKRIKKYGFIKGIFSYSTSQWSRNFTFGMFLTFTLNFSLNGSFIDNEFFKVIYQSIYIGGKYIVISLFILQSILFINHVISQHQKLKVKNYSVNNINYN